MQRHHTYRHITSFQIIILGFFSIAVLGSLLLMLPIATSDGKGANPEDAVFTSTSAVCVTGLITRDTATYWSVFGQTVILALIQIGGMGVVTVAVSIAALSGKKIGLKQRSVMQESISAPQVGGIVRMTRFILKTAVIIEVCGAAALFPAFCRDFGILKGIFYSVFHSVSAFCNAGFDLTGVKEHFSSLTAYSANPIVNTVIMALIITGGIGFLTWEDIKNNKWHIRKYRMQSKAVLFVSALLIILPALYFFFFEFSDMPIAERFWSSLFQSVTPRTAGFNTANLTDITETGLTVMITLMLIGGAPGSTAGGMKVTTAAVLLTTVLSIFRKEEQPHIFKRRIADAAVRNAATVMLMYIIFFLGGGMIISYIEKVPLISALFETSSAIGTVGLSLGLTPKLGITSHLILIVLMFVGRVGGLTLVFAALPKKEGCSAKYPLEKITVG